MGYDAVVLADSPVAYWRLGEASGTVATDLVGSNHGTINGSPVMGVLGITLDDTAITFDGVDDDVTTGSNTPYTATGPFSIECWWQTATAPPAYGSHIVDNKGTSRGIDLEVFPGSIVAKIGAFGADFPITATMAVDDGVWHHAVMVRTIQSPADHWLFYVDGVLIGESTMSSLGTALAFTGSFPFRIGRDAGGDRFTGTLDEVVVYNTALTAAQVLAHYEGLVVIKPPLYYRIGHGSLQIRDSVGDAPTTLSLRVLGHRPPGNAPVRIGLEPTTLKLAATIAGSDAAPGVLDLDVEPLVFEGVLQTIEEHYDGLRTQLAWQCTAIDHVYELNKLRPFGSFEDVAGHVVVETIMGTYAPDFDLAFVQQIAIPITITFDGSREMSACLTAIAAQLGGCHWYLDLFALHFYHLGVNDGDVVVETRPPAPPAVTAPVVSAVAQDGWPNGWALFSITNVYSNGLESQRSDSVLGYVDPDLAVDFSGLPLGSPFLGMPVVKRYLYQHALEYLGSFDWVRPPRSYVAIINDNTSTSYRWPALPGARTPPPRIDPAPAPLTAPSFTFSGTIPGSTVNPLTGVRFAVAFIYETGAESELGPWSSTVLSDTTEAEVTFADLPIGTPNVDGKVVLCRAVYFSRADSGTSDFRSSYGVHLIPNNTDTDWMMVTYTPGEGMIYAYGGPVGGTPSKHSFTGEAPVVSGSGAPTFGPSLEDDLEQPDPLTDDSLTLIHDNPPLTSSEDATQLRTRVLVIGASRPLTADTDATDTAVAVDEAIFDNGGGAVLIGGVRLAYASSTSGSLVLPAGATVGQVWLAGTPVSLIVQVDDYQAQAELGEREAVAGVPTDGVREFTIVDTSLDSVAACLERGYAELALYARPILTVRYGTYDRKTRAGRLVAIDLTDPPLQHDGLLIQDVTIDQFEVGPVAWAPRYVVTASSVRFTLDDLLRRVQLDD